MHTYYTHDTHDYAMLCYVIYMFVCVCVYIYREPACVGQGVWRLYYMS